MPEVFGRYVIERHLASGVLGEVSLAQQTGPDGFSRRCVVKRLNDVAAQLPENVEAFLFEARHVAQLSHPHVAQVYDFGKVGQTHYLAMEYVDGPSLLELLQFRDAQREYLDVAVCCRIASQVAQALDHVHHATDAAGEPLGLVHRDVNPANVLLTKAGAAKLIDFGIAREALEAVTVGGVPKGQRRYMSLEQRRGQRLDGRTDVYSLAKVLYHLLERPGAGFEPDGDDPEHRPASPPPPRAGLPEALLAVLERALQPKRELRYGSAAELSDALEQVIAQLGVKVTAARLAQWVEKVRGAATPSPCPDEEQLLRLAEGALPEAQALLVRAHLDGCESCRELVALSAPQAAEAAEAPAVKERIGRYEVEGTLGRGNMGLVVKALDPQLKRRVAVKLMTAAGRRDAERRARFLREGQAAARVRHPNVVQVYELGVDGDEPFVAMELVEGKTLREWLEKEQPSSKVLLGVLFAIAQGLAAIHRAGVVHRDIKPENILIDGAGQPRVADFGLARETGSAPLTRKGQLLGTPAYMAPEQLEGQPATPSSDQFAFCCLAFEAFTGVRPFAATGADRQRAEMAAGVADARWARVPAPLRPVLARGLSLDATSRFASMEELVAALERPQARRTGWTWLGPLAAAALGALAVLAWLQAEAPGRAAPQPLGLQVPAPGAEPPPAAAEPVADTEPAPQAKDDATGTLWVTTPQPMELWVDGRAVGATPRRVRLPEGPHRVLLRAKGKGPVRQQLVDVAKGKVRRLDYVPRQVTVDVRGAPPQVEFKVFVDGEAVGATPLAPLSLWEGPRRVRVESDTGWKAEKVVELEGAKVRLKVTDQVGIEVSTE